MDLPPFDEFKSSITDDRFLEICNNLTRTDLINIVGGFTPENISALCKQIIMFSVKASFTLQLSFLEEYHEWLRSNL